MPAYTPKMTHEQRRLRREEAAAAVKAGRDVREVALSLGLSVPTVRGVCGMDYHNFTPVLAPPFVVLKRLIDDPLLTMDQLARELGVSKERISQIAKEASKVGWDVKQVGRVGRPAQIIQIASEEQP